MWGMKACGGEGAEKRKGEEGGQNRVRREGAKQVDEVVGRTSVGDKGGRQGQSREGSYVGYEGLGWRRDDKGVDKMGREGEVRLMKGWAGGRRGEGSWRDPVNHCSILLR